MVLVATGRVANVEDIGLEAAGVDRPSRAASRSTPTCARTCRTSTRSGDVAANWQLAHTAFREGEIAAENALGHASEIDYRSTPRCVYTDPEIASVGLSEAQAREAHGDDVVVGTMPYAAIARAAMYGDRTGFVKVIGEARYGELLGMVAVGTQATELIEAGVVAIEAEATLETLGDSLAAHPTLGEATKEAALVALGRPLHIPRRRSGEHARDALPPADAARRTRRRRRREPPAARARRHGAGRSARACGRGCRSAGASQKRVQEIIREEMDRIGGQEMLMPVLHPAEIWKRSGRYDIGRRLQAQRPRRSATSCSRSRTRRSSRCTRSQTHPQLSRPAADLVPHPDSRSGTSRGRRGGVLRTREFTMKDSYTLDRDEAGLDEGYAKHEEAYDRIYARCGLEFYKVESDTGMMGGSVRARVHGALAARARTAWRAAAPATTPRTSRWPSRASSAPAFPPSAPVGRGRDARRRDDRGAGASSSAIDPRTTAKAMPVVTDDGKLWLALVRGDRRLHELKLSKVLRQSRPSPRTPEEIEAAFGAKPGSIGPVGVRPRARSAASWPTRRCARARG